MGEAQNQTVVLLSEVVRTAGIQLNRQDGVRLTLCRIAFYRAI